MEQLPVDFIKEISDLLGKEESVNLESALHDEPVISIRVNVSKGFALEGSEIGVIEGVPWCTSGYYLKERPSFTFDPLFHAGAYYVQEASSMFLEQVIRSYVQQPVIALDLCAAPGGKSTHIRSLLPEGSILVCNEIIRSRSQILAENMIKWGHPGVLVTNNQPSDFIGLNSLFDIVFTDVPCSGEGMFRKDPGAIREWSTDNVELCRCRQRKIISEIWNCIKPGGLLVYSTCTYNRKEDEDNISWIQAEFGARVLPVNHLPEWGINDHLPGINFPAYRFFPHRTKGEGFFMALLQKPGSESGNPLKPLLKIVKKQSVTPSIPDICKSWLNHSEQFFFGWNNQVVVAVPAYAEELYRVLNQKLRVVHAGIPLAEIKGKNLIPLHPAAMSACLNISAFHVVDVSYEQAVSYLRREAVMLEGQHPQGPILLTYQYTPLGFVKNLGNRTNNLYPQEWRIRSGYNSGIVPFFVTKK